MLHPRQPVGVASKQHLAADVGCSDTEWLSKDTSFQRTPAHRCILSGGGGVVVVMMMVVVGGGSASSPPLVKKTTVDFSLCAARGRLVLGPFRISYL